MNSDYLYFKRLAERLRAVLQALASSTDDAERKSLLDERQQLEEEIDRLRRTLSWPIPYRRR